MVVVGVVSLCVKRGSVTEREGKVGRDERTLFLLFPFPLLEGAQL